MAQPVTPSKKFWILLPAIGCVLFIILYVIAAILYPGGSEGDKTATGYNWTKNYWCNLLYDKAINGKINTAKPVAVVAMVILCISLSAFWILFAATVQIKKYQRSVIQIAGTLSMITAFLLLTKVDHDIAVNTSSFFGAIATIGTIAALYKLRWKILFLFGLFNVTLIALNNLLYHSAKMTYLPIVQKVSFLSFLIWFCLIDLKLFKANRFNASHPN